MGVAEDSTSAEQDHITWISTGHWKLVKENEHIDLSNSMYRKLQGGKMENNESGKKFSNEWKKNKTPNGPVVICGKTSKETMIQKF